MTGPPDRSAELLNAIAQASIAIQRSVAELEQLGDPGPARPRCESMATCWGRRHRCQLITRHGGEHQAGTFTWPEPPVEQRYCGHEAKATGVEVRCERLAGHPGPHQRGEMSWPNAAQPRDERPHSRACGMHAHPHGPACAADCPTCGWNRPRRTGVCSAPHPLDGPLCILPVDHRSHHRNGRGDGW